MLTNDEHVKEFAERKYTHVKGLIPEGDRVELLQYALTRSETATMKPDTRVPGTPAAYADPHMESLLERLTPVMEQITGLPLFPTYSYFRVYKMGDALERHTDRQACEVSVSLSLGYVADAPWPLWIEGPRGRASVEMRPGDAMVYRGSQCLHWREAFGGRLAAQVFLHYVDQHGPQAEWKFDKRRRLGTLPRRAEVILTSIRAPLAANNVLDLSSGELLQLDSVRAMMWGNFVSETTIAAIVTLLANRFAMSQPEAEIEIMKFISLCEEKNLVRVQTWPAHATHTQG
jgi:hypothetical protein